MNVYTYMESIYVVMIIIMVLTPKEMHVCGNNDDMILLRLHDVYI